MISEKKYLLLNAALFQGVWFTCILGSEVYAIIATVAFLAIHYILAPKSFEFDLILGVAVCGFLMDYIFTLTGFLELKSTWDFPIFLLCIWFGFAATLKYSASAFFKTPSISAIVGLLAPFSYFAAQKMEKVVYSEPLYSSIILHSVLWCVLMLIINLSFFKKEISVNA